MTRLIVLGGTGYAGTHLVTEAAARGLDVVSVSRTAPDSLPDGARHEAVDLADDAALARLFADADAVVATVSPRGDLEGEGVLRSLYAEVARLAAQTATRLGVIGGAGSLHVAEGGPRLIDTPDFPEAFKAEGHELGAVLEDLRGSDDALDWFFVSPAAGFGAFSPGEATGTYRVGGDVLLTNEAGESFISGADLALAVIDEIETPAHRRERFTVAS